MDLSTAPRMDHGAGLVGVTPVRSWRHYTGLRLPPPREPVISYPVKPVPGISTRRRSSRVAPPLPAGAVPGDASVLLNGPSLSAESSPPTTTPPPPRVLAACRTHAPEAGAVMYVARLIDYSRARERACTSARPVVIALFLFPSLPREPRTHARRPAAPAVAATVGACGFRRTHKHSSYTRIPSK